MVILQSETKSDREEKEAALREKLLQSVKSAGENK